LNAPFEQHTTESYCCCLKYLRNAWGRDQCEYLESNIHSFINVLAEGVATADQSDGLRVVEVHAGEHVADLDGAVLLVGDTEIALRVDVDEADGGGANRGTAIS